MACVGFAINHSDTNINDNQREGSCKNLTFSLDYLNNSAVY